MLLSFDCFCFVYLLLVCSAALNIRFYEESHNLTTQQRFGFTMASYGLAQLAHTPPDSFVAKIAAAVAEANRSCFNPPHLQSAPRQRLANAQLDLRKFVEENQVPGGEGGSDTFYTQQCLYGLLPDLVFDSSVPKIQICEIGFNVGYGALLWLESSPRVSYLGFDAGFHQCVYTNSKYFQKKYGPSRFRLLLGRSHKVIPKFVAQNPNFRCHILSIDGDHSERGALLDFVHMFPLAAFTKDSGAPAHLGLIDDVNCVSSGCKGTVRAFRDAGDHYLVNTVYNHWTWGRAKHYRGRVRQRGFSIFTYNRTVDLRPVSDFINALPIPPPVVLPKRQGWVRNPTGQDE